jgi:hypothetical protein
VGSFPDAAPVDKGPTLTLPEDGEGKTPAVVDAVIPGRALARTGIQGLMWGSWIPGSARGGPGMTTTLVCADLISDVMRSDDTALGTIPR